MPWQIAYKGIRLSNRTKLVLKILGSVLFGILLLEGTLRLIGRGPQAPAPHSKEKVDVEELSMKDLIRHAFANGWINEPNSSRNVDFQGEAESIKITRNWLGVREDDATPVQTPPGKRRIVVLGDSHTDGIVPNNQSYANLLEQQLGNGFDVVNCAQGASSPYDQLWAYQKIYSRLNPEIVIVGFYAGNDYIDLMNQHRSSFLKWNGNQFVRAPKTGRPDISYEQQQTTILDQLCRQTAIFYNLQKANLIGGNEKSIRVRRDKNYFDRLVQARDEDPASTWQGLNQAYFFRHCPGEWELAHQKFEYILEQFKQITPHDRLLFLIIPTFRQLQPDSVKVAADILELVEQDLMTDERVCDDAKRLLEKANIPFIDLRTVMKSTDQKLFWTFDHHINDVAHRLIATEIMKSQAVKNWVSANTGN